MREKIAIKSSIIGLLSKLTTVIMSLVIARLFTRHLGVEIRGIEGVFSNVLGFLQLAEMGIGTAIIYALYQPLQDNNTEEVKVLMRFYKIIYRWIALIIMALGLALMPFLSYLIKDYSYSILYVRVVFFIQLFASASTYLLAYKRNLLYADQRQYISTLIDSIVNVISGCIRIFIILYTGSFILYLIMQVAQNIISNLIVHLWCNKQYPYILEKTSAKYDKMDELKNNVKHLMVGRLASWVYNSTDNLIISKFVGVMMVGLMSNYYTLIKMIKLLVDSVVAPIQPMIGRYVCEQKDVKSSYSLFLSYTFIRYCIANVVVVGIICMCSPVVSVWIGSEYTVEQIVVILLSVDMFISITHGPTGEFIQALGLFKDDRNMSIVAMILNLSVSLILVFRIGVAGVLLGTVAAQLYYWYKRSSIVFSQYFHDGVARYIFKILKYVLTMCIDVVVVQYIYSLLPFDGENVFTLLIKGIVSVMVSIISLILTNFGTPEFKYSYDMINRQVIMRIKGK